jgi:hypothetical protein
LPPEITTCTCTFPYGFAEVCPVNDPDLNPLAVGVGVALLVPVGVGEAPPDGGAPEGVAVGAGVGLDDEIEDGVRVATGGAGGVRKLKSRTTPMAVAARVMAARKGMAVDTQVRNAKRSQWT